MTTPTIAVHCNGCGRRFSVKVEHAGKQGKCPRCGSTVDIPKAELPDEQISEHISDTSDKGPPKRREPAAKATVRENESLPGDTSYGKSAPPERPSRIVADSPPGEGTRQAIAGPGWLPRAFSSSYWRTAGGLLVVVLLVAVFVSRWNQQTVTVEYDPTVEGIWRSLDSKMAFQLDDDQRAEFFHGGFNEIVAADYSKTNGRLRIEIGTRGVVENFLVRDGYLEHEKTGAAYFADEQFLKKWLGTSFADLSAVLVPVPGERFFIETDKEDLFEPRRGRFGTGYLAYLREMVDNHVVLASLEARGDPDEDVKRFECTLNAEAESLPRVKNIRDGLIGIQQGSFEVHSISSARTSERDPVIRIVAGTYIWHPNVIGKRLLAVDNKRLREKYKFLAAIRTARTIADQPRLKAFDFGYTDQEGYETNKVEQLASRERE